MLDAWERSAGATVETMVRDPRVLALGASWMRAQLQGLRAGQQLAAAAWDVAWAPWAAFTGAGAAAGAPETR
jgi:hypothetical protein